MTFAEYLVKFTKEYEEFIADLLQTGAEAAQRNYDHGNVYGEDTATVTAEIEGDHGRIVATGEGISFLEFGAGIEAGTTGMTEVVAPYSIAPGSWSRDHGRQFYLHGYWYYDGERYYSKTPTGAMQDASIEMQQMVRQIAGRHFT